MVDVFISYRSPDRARADKIAKTLEEEGLSVWWDQDLRGQVYSLEIGAKLAAASAVLALASQHWSIFAAAGATPPVLHEIDRAGRRLIVARLDHVKFEDLPMPMCSYNSLNLVQWHGNRLDPEWRKVVARCYELSGRHQRDQEIPAQPEAAPLAQPEATSPPGPSDAPSAPKASDAQPGGVTATKIGVVVQSGDVTTINVDQRD